MNTGSFWKRHKAVALFSIFSVICVLVLAGLWGAGFRVNLTPSLPKGVYRLTGEQARKGDLVSFCLASSNPFSQMAGNYLGNGSCPSGLRPLLKKLTGVPGDQIKITPGGLILNDEPLANTVISTIDRNGREIPPSLLAEGTIPAGFGLVISQEHSGSFDSRYFGLIPLASLKTVKPFLISMR